MSPHRIRTSTQLIFAYSNPCLCSMCCLHFCLSTNKWNASNIICCLSHCSGLLPYFHTYTKLSKYEKNKPFDFVFTDSLSDAVCVLTCTLCIVKWWFYIICNCEGWWISRVSLTAQQKINTWIIVVVAASFKEYLETCFQIILSMPEPHKQFHTATQRKGN